MPVTPGVLRTTPGRYPRAKIVNASGVYNVTVSTLTKEQHDAFLALATERGLAKGGLAKRIIAAVVERPEKIAMLLGEGA